MLLDLVGEYEAYTRKLNWLADQLADEARRNTLEGMVRVHDGVRPSLPVPQRLPA